MVSLLLMPSECRSLASAAQRNGTAHRIAQAPPTTVPESRAAFERRGEIQPLPIETSDGRLITHRLQDARPQSPVEWLVRPFIETRAQRETREGVEAAFTEYKNRLQADVEKTGSYLKAAQEIASHQVAERNLRAGYELPAPGPEFTPKELSEIEIHAERRADSQERANYLALVRDGAQNGAQSRSDSYSQTRSPEPVVHEVASGMERGR
jgi:hypothetical protein